MWDLVSRERVIHSSNVGGEKRSVLVGIPVYNSEKTITSCLEKVLNQAQSSCYIQNVLVVASGCTDNTVELVKRKQSVDARLLLLEEGTRRGKASALNKIFEFFNTHPYDYLVVTNGDTKLDGAAVDRLIEHAEHTGARLVCGSPKPSTHPVSRLNSIYEFIWELHNLFLEVGSKLEKPHCTDELMCFSSDVSWRIPSEVVNDGAYFSVLLAVKGEKRGYCSQAIVGVSVPKTVSGLIKQRSRIVLGHVLLKERFGVTSDTFESTVILKPKLAIDVLAHQVIKRGLICFIKTTAIEGISLFVAMIRYMFGSEPWIWERVEYAEADT
ncbi:hypothetical protein B9Q06_04975 [Candidatus Marsarchaeota G2 archaeon ECH_B_2]|uniref:Glycosyltransferase 2-like domain-containing protein n=3 Tax=Candidatus Marsarchaeota group 2 TaxID=2203771 RepID=A0A2R6BAS6_9ARCH|nr:MAG: hypothetical protein B9Q06_04975 [Candidatus Marsarchaeota G2 archaeon ECH_B_2]PSO00298.1 MAG: hypothetical protein B9Q07_04060 [Candidatus Marsarchaeota G2 archaeon ECH_B_3]PSO02435.1 MAG: hypothetical protein B9Q05_05260 [Candidatus Marsarchaeota G2 archaeon ECH_B_1]